MDEDDDVRPRLTTLASLYFAPIAGTIGVLGMSGVWLYFAGAANRDRESTFMLVWLAGLAVAVTAVVTLIALIALHYERKPPLAGHAGAAACVLVLLGSAAWIFSPSTVDAYDKGFADWVKNHVDEKAILAWHGALPPSATTSVQVLHAFDPPAPTETPPADWPPEIASLKPKRVNRLANGVMLEWGSFATWGHSRRAFISTDDVDPTPTEPNKHFSYAPLRPSLWAAVQPTY